MTERTQHRRTRPWVNVQVVPRHLKRDIEEVIAWECEYVEVGFQERGSYIPGSCCDNVGTVRRYCGYFLQWIK